MEDPRPDCVQKGTSDTTSSRSVLTVSVLLEVNNLKDLNCIQRNNVDDCQCNSSME